MTVKEEREMDDKLREAIAGQITVDSNCGIDSDFPCPYDAPLPGYEKCKQGEVAGTCMWQRGQAENIIAVIRAHGWQSPEEIRLMADDLVTDVD